MAIAHVSTGTGLTGNAGTTTVTITYPASLAVGNMVLCGRTVKPETATAVDEAGWTTVVNGTGGTGTTGLDVGQTRGWVGWREVIGGEGAGVDFDQGATPNSVSGQMIQFSKAAGTFWEVVGGSGNDTTQATGRAATSSAMNLGAGDMLIAFVHSNTDATTAWTTPTFTATGMTFGARTALALTGASQGNDSGISIVYAAITAGTAASVTPAISLAGGPTNCGPVTFIRLRELSPPLITQAAYRFYDEAGTESGSTALAAQDTAITADLNAGVGYGQLRIRLQSTSAVAVGATDDFRLQYERNASGTWVYVPSTTVLGYNAAGLTDAQATTNRLTGGTGTFTAGKVSEDGLVDDVGWSGNNYTELVYALQINGATLVNGDTLRFRVLRNGVTTGLTYTAVPTINVVSSATFTPVVLDTLAAWLDPTDPAPFSLSGTEILTWNDKGPNAYVATGAALTSAQRPNRTGTINGLTTVTFDGGDWLRSNIPATMKPFTFATVINLTAGTTDRTFIGCSAAAAVGDGGWQLRASFTTDEFTMNTSNTAEIVRTTVVPEGTPTLIVFTYSAVGAWTLRYNKVQVNSGTSNATPTAARFHLIGNNSYTSAVEAFTGQMGDIVLCNDVLAGADLTDLENYLYTKWFGAAPVEIGQWNGLSVTAMQWGSLAVSAFQGGLVTETQLRLLNNTMYLSTPDHADFVFTAFDVSWFGSVDDITQSDQCFLSQWTTTGSQRCWSFRYAYVSSQPQLRLYLSTDGVANVVNANGSAPITITNGQYFGVRVTWRMSDGAVRFYYSATDPPSWTLVGTSTLLSGGPLFNATSVILFGGTPTAQGHLGYVRRAEIRNGYDGAGSIIAAPNMTVVADTATGLTDANGKVWTAAGSADFVRMPKP